MSDYSMYRYYRGEKENPFEWEKENTANQFWGYEALFEHKFNTDADFQGKNKASAFKQWIDALFIRLADRHDCMDGGEHFRIKYKLG
ncbi:MAG: hypothetical protein LBP83_07230 [Dysgonamonadaceae bacterium]|jgi:hypothetical protein|nr:hypothetical protein [Dysgonamonadaceae bacterium]